MTIFEQLQQGAAIDIRNVQYQKEVHGEINRCDHLCYQINHTDPELRQNIVALENQLLGQQMQNGTYFTPPLSIDCGSQVTLGSNVYANHHLTMMALGGITIEAGVMLGPGVSLLTVNHEPKNIRVVKTGQIRIGENAWIGANVSILPGVTIGANAIVGTGAVVTKDVPANTVVAGVPAKVLSQID